MMLCSGRTQGKLPPPQRMDLGQGISRIAASIRAGRTVIVSAPFFSTTAK
jgi:hypothetical protein